MELIPLAPTETAVSTLRAKPADITLVVLEEGITHYNVSGFIRPLRAAVPWIKTVWYHQ